MLLITKLYTILETPPQVIAEATIRLRYWSCPAGPLLPLAASNKIPPLRLLRFDQIHVVYLASTLAECDRGMVFLRNHPATLAVALADRILHRTAEYADYYRIAEIRAVEAGAEEIEEALYRRVANGSGFTAGLCHQVIEVK